MTKFYISMAASVAVLLSSACSSSGSDDAPATGATANNVSTNETGSNSPLETDNDSTNTQNPPVSGGGNLTYFGGVNASYDPLDDETSWNGQFFASAVAFPVSELENQFPAPTNTCKTSEVTTPTPLPADTGIDPENLSFIPDTASAGDVLTVTSPAGTHASLIGQQLFGFLLYSTQDRVPVAGPMPESLVIDIPGAPGGFPAFSSVAFPSVQATEFTVQDGLISWEGSNAEGSKISIITSARANSDFATQVFIECDLIDDGSHQIEP
ncbi:MAG: hypothetical protein KTR35_22670, partial [Gammaproteobacteria bacterium]|nr:hypothetical protein [Gammaproteobacteria bacterium]